MKYHILFILFLTFSGSASAYIAECVVQFPMDRHTFDVEVKNKVLTLNSTVEIPFLRKFGEWYLYQDDDLLIKTGPFIEMNNVKQFKVIFTYRDEGIPSEGACMVLSL